MTGLDAARRAKAALRTRFGADPRVVGVGLGRDGDAHAVEVRLAEALPDGEMPATVDGVPVRYRVVGRIDPAT